MNKLIAVLAICGALPGCGGAGSSGQSGGGGVPGGWTALDACKTLDKAVVAATLRSSVTTAELNAVKSEGGGFPLYSQCAYQLADGRMLVFGTGQYTNGTTQAEQVKDIRKQLASISKTGPVDLPGVGKAALWAEETHMMYVFIGNDRYLSANLAHIPSLGKSDPNETTETVKADEIAILRKAGA